MSELNDFLTHAHSDEVENYEEDLIEMIEKAANISADNEAGAENEEIVEFYYAKPTQVLFYDADEGQWLAGIAYMDEIICADCGCIWFLEDIVQLAREDGELNPIRNFTYWVDLTLEIAGCDADELNKWMESGGKDFGISADSGAGAE